MWARVSEPPTSIDYASFEDFGLVVIDHFGKDRELANVESGVLMRLRLFFAVVQPLAQRVIDRAKNTGLLPSSSAYSLLPDVNHTSNQRGRARLTY